MTSGIARAVVESQKRYKRKPADFYPTPFEATVAVVPHLGLERGAWIAEPACGSGEMAHALLHSGFNVLPSDLRYTGVGAGGVDFLDPENDLARWQDLDAIVTNPPFGLAAEFIRRATQLAPVVALLLKSNYWNAANRLALWDECTPTGHFPLTWRLAFLEKERGKSPLMDCDWWIWRRGDPPLPYKPLKKPKGHTIPPMPPKPLLGHFCALGEAIEELTEALRGSR